MPSKFMKQSSNHTANYTIEKHLKFINNTVIAMLEQENKEERDSNSN